MKVELVNKAKPELKVGQLWRNKQTGRVYMAQRFWTTTYGIILVSTDNFGHGWAAGDGFGAVGPDAFEYLGELKVTP